MDPRNANAGGGDLFGLMAEFETPGELLEAAVQVRDRGFKKWDCHTPYPVHGLDAAMGMRDTRLPWIVLCGALAGTASAVLLQWWTNAVDYPLQISGKPLFSLPANIPVAFELTILFSALAAVASLFLFNKLPRFHHPVFGSLRFRNVTRDRYFIVIEAADPAFDPSDTETFLRSLGSHHVERLEE